MEQKYQIFARKYRPQSFCDVIGQETIVKTLKNSLIFNKTAQAYLFTGPRGVGKTTLTRLLAKALNCKNLTETKEPCNKCVSCKEIASSSSLDVIEIDGASNRGIDDIRQINETIGYAPSSGKYKIYIIDEVHMLTKEAFNALLKTLEEPPSTIKFFFATTEPHKVLPTIISRCQRFDLKSVSKDLILNKLKKIALDQQREITDEALYQIAKLSEGSLRDAESMLDQILCYTDKNIENETINQIFGLIPQDYFLQIDNSILKNDLKIAFTITSNLYKEGKDFSFFIEQLIEHFRHILVSKIQDNDSLNKFVQYSEEQIFYILDILLKALVQIQKTSSKRCFLEMLLMQIIKSKNKISLSLLVQKLSKLEEEIKNKPTQNIKKETQIKITDKKIDNVKKEPLIEKEKKRELIKENKQRDSSCHDTLLNFASVELNGIIKKD
jgi:DNA polymerase-3 subunit gamma/tau